MDSKIVGFVRNVLRNASFKWHTRGKADKRFKIEIGKFKNGNPKYGKICGICRGKFKTGDTEMDHIIPVIGIEGFSGFDVMIPRIFCGLYDWSRVCKPCHETKSKEETEYRKQYRKATKEDKKRLKKEFDEKWEQLKKQIKKDIP